MFSIVDMRRKKIVRKNIMSRKDVVWPDGFVSSGYSEVGEVHQQISSLNDGQVELIGQWKLYEDEIENGEAGRKLRLGPPFFHAELDKVIRDLIPCDDFDLEKAKDLFSEKTLAGVLNIVIKELSLRGQPASREFEKLVQEIQAK